MELEQSTYDIEQHLLYLFVNSKEFLDEFATSYEKGMFENKYVEKIADLCILYYKKSKTAPNDYIYNLFESLNSRKKYKPETASEMKLILESLRGLKLEEKDIEIEIDMAYEYFASQSLKLQTDEVRDLLAEGKFNEAVKIMSATEVITRSPMDGCDILLQPEDSIDALFNQADSERIIKLSGALGNLMNNVLVRNGFVSLMGRNKVGKSFWLMYFARIARNQGRKVIYISSGDMTRSECEKRILQGDLETSINKLYCKDQRIPYLDCVKNQKGSCFNREGVGDLLDEFSEVNPVIKLNTNEDYKPCTACMKSKPKEFERAITYRQVRNEVLSSDLVKEFIKVRAESNPTGVLHVESFPNSTLNCRMLGSVVRKICKFYGWDNPDLLVVDYPDIMADEDSDERKSINKRWKYLKACADPKVFNCLVLVATQANASGLDFEDLALSSFAEDRRKLDHVTAFFAINQTPEERQQSIWRIAVLNKRYHPFDETKQAYCIGCLAMGTVHQLSYNYRSQRPKAKSQYKR